VTGPDHPGPGIAGASPAPAWRVTASRARLEDDVSVTVPRHVWINFLAWAHVDHPRPGIIPWIDQLVTEVERAVDS
jgi:hypothetical protein